MEEIRKEDRKRNDMKNNVLHIRKMVSKLNLTVKNAMDIIEIPVEDRPIVAQLVNSSGLL